MHPCWLYILAIVSLCFAGLCALIISAEWITFAAPFPIIGTKLLGSWVIDYIFAYLYGIAFQYFSIKPMREFSPGQSLWAAIKADTLSLTSWQVGMYGWMALAMLVIFGHELRKANPIFWFMMQIAMLAGFLTSYPVNWWLLKKGIRGKM